MSSKNKLAKDENSGCGCLGLLLFIGFGIWLVPRLQYINRQDVENFSPEKIGSIASAVINKGDHSTTTLTATEPTAIEPIESKPVATTPTAPTDYKLKTSVPAIQQAPAESNIEPMAWPTLPAAWANKEMRGIYISRYAITNRASEQMIRDRVRYYKAQGINTIIHGVWGNGCTMYKSEVMKQTLGYSSCPNLFQDDWLVWLIDEAHRQGMQVHAYFEKGIKLDENSPIFDLATQKKWLLPGIDKTYAGVDHYLLDVEKPEVAKYFHEIQAEFVRKYPTIDAVQWDDYLGYHEEISGGVDRTKALTEFALGLRNAAKQTNPNVSFDVCHHNPYWSKQYFDADWKNWNVDRAFIQAYDDKNFAEELSYIEQSEGIAVTDTQFDRLEALANNPNVKSVFLFPSDGDPEKTAARFKQTVGVR